MPQFSSASRTSRLAIVLLTVVSLTNAYAAGLGGTWSGNVTQSDTNDTYSVEMELYGNDGTISYPSFRCGGKLRFIREEGKAFFYRESITYGTKDCIDGGTIQISPSPMGDPNLWNWRWDGGGVSARGVLKGSGKREP